MSTSVTPCTGDEEVGVYIWVRLLRVGMTARSKGRVDLSTVSVVRVRIWPHDLDLWGHLNGGRFVTLSDLGRFDLVVRSGLLRHQRRNHWTFPIGAAAVVYKRPLRAFQSCELHTRMLGWDEKWGYMETRFVRAGQTVAVVAVRGLIRGPEGSVPPSRVSELLGADEGLPSVPDHIRTWLAADTPVP